ncbi:rRNA-processing protein bfr2 [Tulasnella sp. UAMH 9824]|nr:rRNA-processing protein bfr2 [Tulasnella sp. UAMH 9824]
MSRLTLAQQIAHLEDTVPDYDPEDAYNAVESNDPADQGLTLGLEDTGREHYVEVGKSSLRKLHESAPDPKYNAVKTTRSKIFDDDEDPPDEDALGGDLAKFAILTGPADDDDDEDEDEDEDEMSGDEEMEDEEVERSEDEWEEEEAYQPSKPFGEVREESDVAKSEDDEELDEGDGSEVPSNNVRKQVDEDEGDRQLAEALRKTREQDRAKGKAVAKQLATWDTLLDSRIRLQKSVVAANRLPLPENISQLVSNNSEADAAVNRLLEATLNMSDDLMEFQEASRRSLLLLLHMKAHEDNLEVPPRKKRKLDSSSAVDYEAQVREATAAASALEATYHRTLLQTLHKWSAKVQAVAPSALLSTSFKGSSKSFQQQNGVKSAVDLIDETLSGGKAITRTRVRRTEGERIETGSGEVVAKGMESIDADELFDDTDFYQQLLRDVIDSRTAGKDASENIDAADAWARKQKKAQKAERALGNKDKRVRYDVHEKLQNFMVPIPMNGMRGTWHEEQIDELFSSLLGKGFEGAAQESINPLGVASNAVAEEQEANQHLASILAAGAGGLGGLRPSLSVIITGSSSSKRFWKADLSPVTRLPQMKGPTGSSVFEATRTLLRSIQEENKEIREASFDRLHFGSQQRFPDDADNNLAAMELTIEAVRKELGSQIVAARRKRNTLLPVFRLPPEVLVEIFHISLESHLTCGITNPPYLDRLKKLASVCSSWLALLRSTPSLWAVLESSCPITFLPVVLRNSKSSLLNIRTEWEAYDFWHRTNKDKEHHRKFLQTIIEPSLTERWSSVYIDLPHDTGPIKVLMERSFPNLRNAHFGQAQWGWKQGPVNLFSGDTGRLQEFRIKGIPLRWDTISLAGLRLLALKSEAPSSSAKLLNLLAASPALESLTLTGLPAPSNSEQDNLSIIHLPQLKELVLVDNEAGSIIPLLQSIRTSTLDKFWIIHQRYNRGYGDDFVSELDTLGHLNSALQSTVDSATDLDLTVGGEMIRCTAKRGSEVCLEVHLTGTKSSKVFQWISESITLDSEEVFIRDTKLTLDYGWGSRNTSAFLPVVEWLGDITELVLNDYYGSNEVLKWLSERIVEGNKVEWRCPGLRKLSILTLAWLKDVVDFAVKRYGGGEEDDTVTHEGDLTVYWPDCLDYVDISGLNHDHNLDSEAVEELYDLLGCIEIVGYDGEREREDDDDDDDYY